MNISLQLSHRPQFERNITRAVVAGALAGFVAVTLFGSQISTPLQWLVATATIAAFAGGDRFDRWVVRAFGAALPILALVFASPLGTMLCGGIVGLMLMTATVTARGSEATVAQLRPGASSYAAAIIAGVFLFPLGLVVGSAINNRLEVLRLSVYLTVPVAGAIAALFASLAAAPGHVLLREDPVEARGTGLMIRFPGELAEQISVLMTSYRHCGDLLAKLPRETARAELAQTLSRSTNEALELAEHWCAVDAQLDAGAREDLQTQLQDLKGSATASHDALAKRQLELAAASLEEELGGLKTLSVERERAMAKLKALSAQLGRTRIALLGLQAAQSQVKAADLMALSRKVQALSSLEATRAALDTEAAVAAELQAMDQTPRASV